MDVVSQVMLGAGVGLVVGGRHLGGKAVLAGAVGGILPDLDVLPMAMWRAVFGDGFKVLSHGIDYWQYHRGISHSLLFGPLLAVPLAYLSKWWVETRQALRVDELARPSSFLIWYLVWMLALVTHALLDSITHWGTMLFAPLSDVRYGISALPIIDIAFSLMLIGGFVYAWRRGVRTIEARNGMIFALALSCVWIGYGWLNNKKAVQLTYAELAEKGEAVGEVHAYTTLLTPWLRRVVANVDGQWRVGYVSTWPVGERAPIKWRAATSEPEALSVMQKFRETEWGRIYFNFANGPVRAKLVSDGNGGEVLRLHDMRYGVPGDTFDGFWGLVVPAAKARNGDLPRAEIGSFLNRPRVSNRQFAKFWRATFRLPQDVY